MISIRNVSFSYDGKNSVLKNINLDIKKGECILLCGKSGCGKTTVTKLINGLIPHFYEGCSVTGEVTVNGENIFQTEIYELAQMVGSVFQNPKSQFFNLDSDAEIVFGMENSGVNPDIIKERLELTTQALRIEKLRHRNVFSMSGGEKQSLAFASVYAMNPDVYVLDEPTANLDERAIDILKTQIKKVKSEGKTILISEHRIYFLKEIIDRVIYIEDGEIEKEFTRDEFLLLNDNDRIRMGLRTLDNRISWKNKYNKSLKKDKLIVKDLAYKYKNKEVFTKLSFEVSSGEILGVTGYNGAGKTTFLRCLAGLLPFSDGDIQYNGKTLKRRKRNKLSYMIMQDVNHQLFSDCVWNECKSLSKEVDCEEISTILKAFSLDNWKQHHPMALSGGQKQRLAIATGILSRKRILLFDEPTSGLDYENMIAVSGMIKKLSNQDFMIIIVSHDKEFLSCTCNRQVKI